MSLNEKMKEYKKQIDQQSRQSVNGSCEVPGVDCPLPFTKSTDKAIEEVMQSSANGQVCYNCQNLKLCQRLID